jgi:hypothetical protein
MIKFGTQCLRCSNIFYDKAGFNRHHKSFHTDLSMEFKNQVAYTELNGVTTTEIEWDFETLPQESAPAQDQAAPGLLERETRYLTKGERLFSAARFVAVADPGVLQKDSASQLLDYMDEFALEASTVARIQVMRTKSGDLKARPFHPLKDCSGSYYVATLARFLIFARIHFGDNMSLQELCIKSLDETCNSTSICCLEGFILCLTVHAPNHKKADPLQHAAMHMRRVLRGSALLYFKEHPEIDIKVWCDCYLTPSKATPFGVLSTMYFEIKRCVPSDKRLLIHRCDPDETFPAGSAVLVCIIVDIAHCTHHYLT